MGFRDKLQKYYADNYMKKYGDRITQAYGSVLSVKVEEKKYLWLFNVLTATIIIKPDGSKNVVRSVYKAKRWFKKPDFINVSQGHVILIQALKGKKGSENSEVLEIKNIRNVTTRKDLFKIDAPMPKKQVQYKRK
ncbi:MULTISPECIES: hypothetical protein [Proteiniclasticum]|jgi:hypothetical protein|uniref:Uncharacterized protein n=1 Tax=Proteiniclasticum ruminis TaxID=398199 RepID=A0A1I4XTK4_9CLOT|nr:MULTISPECIES: hypothetical protein [Proteiniclasticum]SFN29208.1 hypothetical protein SAMN04488695_101177 [Proteiniclasticum ruminis]HBW14223.1 hypothetical protein [Proteiniclasticum sp.]